MITFDRIIKEIHQIETLTDEAEKSIRYDLLDDVMDKIHEYNGHIYDYEYRLKWQEIMNRGVSLIPYSKPSSLRANWSKLFSSTVTSDDKKQIRYDHYKWHIFSFEKINALSGTKARTAFNHCKKETVYAFYQHSDEAYSILNPDLLKSSDFDSEQDVYLFDPIHKWTYVYTHEAQCGPYFYKV